MIWISIICISLGITLIGMACMIYFSPLIDEEELDYED